MPLFKRRPTRTIDPTAQRAPNGVCGYMYRPGRTACARPSTTHHLILSPESTTRYKGLETCDEHTPGAAAWTLDRHPLTDACHGHEPMWHPTANLRPGFCYDPTTEAQLAADLGIQLGGPQ